MFSFSLGDIPIRIHGSFLIMTAFLSMSGGSGMDLRFIALWVVVVFVSVVVHELGHALVGKSFGLTPQIDLHGMGGTTSWAHKNVSSGRRILISLAGPFLGIVVGAALKYGPFFPAGSLSVPGREAVAMIIWVNLGWGLINLLPMLPLDGGNVMAQLLQIATGGKGERAARIVSIVVAVLAGLVGLLFYGGVWYLILAAMFVGQNIQALRAAAPDPPPPPPAPARW